MVIVHRASSLINKHSFSVNYQRKFLKHSFFLNCHEGDKIVVWYLVYNSLDIETGFEFDL